MSRRHPSENSRAGDLIFSFGAAKIDIRGTILKQSQVATAEELPLRMSELGNITSGWGQSNIIFDTTVCKANRKGEILPTRTDNYGQSLELVNSEVWLKSNSAC